LKYTDDKDLWHPFDWEFEQKNKFLFRPISKQFKSWDDYRTLVNKDSGEKLFRKNAKHYHHYYQIHQVYSIQNKYPVYAKNNLLLQNVKDEYKKYARHLKPNNVDPISTLYGYSICFDALSFFIELYENEQDRTFKPIPENNGIKTLNDQQVIHFQKSLEIHANNVLQRFGLADEDLYQFALFLLKLHTEYERDECLLLANELLVDIKYLVKFIALSVGLSFYKIEAEIDKRGSSVWTKKFRHLDKAVEVYDYARDTFTRLMDNYNAKVAINFNISSKDIEKLLDFIEKQGLFIIPHAIFDIDNTLNESRAFRSTSLYIGLSNLTTGFECYLRDIANIANKLQNNINIKTLHPLIKTMFNWGNIFDQEHSQRQSASNKDPFSYLKDVYKDPNLDEVVKTFLIAYRARNFIAHNYTLEQDLYYKWYSIIYTAFCHGIFYSWIHANNNNWV
jgi:hypothetical protein